MSPLLWVLVVYGSALIIPCIALTAWTFPYTGIALSLSFVLLLIFFAQKKRMAHERGIFILGLLMCFLFVQRASPIQTLLLLSGIVWTGSYLVIGATHPVDGLFMPFRALLAVITTKNILLDAVKKMKNKRDTEVRRVVQIAEISLLTVGTLYITLALLSGTNPYFDIVIKYSGYTYVSKYIIHAFSTIELPILIVRACSWIFLLVILPKTVSFLKKSRLSKEKAINMPLLIPMAVLATLIVVFFATQLTFYFAPQVALNSLGYTYSRYARELFAQLIVLTTISVFLAWYGTFTNVSKKISILILTEGLFLGFIALRSVYSYHMLYGLTQKRVFGYVALVWIFLILVYILYRYIRTHSRVGMMRVVLILSMSVLALTAAINIDRIIYAFGKPRVNNTIDYVYLSRLSTDAYHYHELLPIIMWSVEKKPNAQNVATARELIFKIQMLTDDIQRGDWRSYNTANYAQYAAVKNIPIDAYRTLIDSSAKPVPH